MTYQEALKHALTVPWKTVTCDEGTRCWCRGITPVDMVADSDDNKVYIVATGEMQKEHAEHIVKLHNESLK